jgi:hypothetical protein
VSAAELQHCAGAEGVVEMLEQSAGPGDPNAGASMPTGSMLHARGVMRRVDRSTDSGDLCAFT